jgi:polar amino acid transport system substrate-binding protein
MIAVLILLMTAACGNDEPDAKSSGSDASSGEKVDLSSQEQLTPDYEADPKIHAMLPQSIQDSGEINAALSTGTPPLTFPGATTTEVKGATPDLQRAIEQILGVKFNGRIYPTTAAQLLAIESGRADIALTTNGDTAEREATYQFVDYYKSEYQLTVQGDNVGKITTWQEVCGTKYATIKGTIDIIDELNAACEDAGLEPTEVTYFEDAPSALVAANSGRATAFFSPTTFAVWTDSTGIATASVPAPAEMTTIVGFTLSKDDDELAQAVLAALQKLVDDGYYQEVLDRWGLSAGAITPGINIGDQGSMFD